MQKFKMTCSCGDVMEVEAADRDGAVAQLKAMMTQEAIDAHMAEKHAGQPPMSMADCHAQIDKDVMPAA
jgi:uncharacterized protein YqfB (UPF0267 family)